MKKSPLDLRTAIVVGYSSSLLIKTSRTIPKTVLSIFGFGVLPLSLAFSHSSGDMVSNRTKEIRGSGSSRSYSRTNILYRRFIQPVLIINNQKLTHHRLLLATSQFVLYVDQTPSTNATMRRLRCLHEFRRRPLGSLHPLEEVEANQCDHTAEGVPS